MKKTTNATRQKEDINVLDLFFYLLSQWYWLALSALIFGALAWYKVEKSPYIYSSTITVVIKDTSASPITGFSSSGRITSRINIANEMLQLRSKALLKKALHAAGANVFYQVDNRLRKEELYRDAPVTISFIDDPATPSIFFSLTKKNEQKVTLTELKDAKGQEIGEISLGDTIDTAHGRFVVSPNLSYKDKRWNGTSIEITRYNPENIVDFFHSRLNVRQAETQASVVELSMVDFSYRRANDLLHSLIDIYNQEVIRDKNKVMEATAEFISDRIAIIGRELGSVEATLEQVKRSSKVTDLSTDLYMGESQRSSTVVLELENQMRIVNYLRNFLSDPEKKNALLPVNIGLEGTDIATQISQYNHLKLRMDKLMEESGVNNPVVVEIAGTLAAMRQNILIAVNNVASSLQTRVADTRRSGQRSVSQIFSMPSGSSEIMSTERQQKNKRRIIRLFVE